MVDMVVKARDAKTLGSDSSKVQNVRNHEGKKMKKLTG